MKHYAWLTLAMLVVTTGCSQQMVGTWKTEKVEPADALKHFEMASITFSKDGTYTAMAREDGQERTATGKWTYDGKKLTLTTSEGKTRDYDAAVTGGKELKVSKEMHGRKVTMEMKKMTCEGKKCCCPKKCPVHGSEKAGDAKCPMAENETSK